MVAWGWKWEERLIAIRSEEHSWDDINNLKLDYSDGCFFPYIYKNIVLYLKMIKFLVSKYLNKSVLKVIA